MEIVVNENTGDTLTFDVQKLKALRKAYSRAVKLEHNKLVFEGKTILTRYARHLIEYIDALLN